MSTSVTLYSNRSARTDYKNPYTNYSSNTIEEFNNAIDNLYVGFQPLSSVYNYRHIESISIYSYDYPCIPRGGSNVFPAWSSVAPISSTWIESTLTYDNRPNCMGGSDTNKIYDTAGNWVYKTISDSYETHINNILTYGAIISPRSDYSYYGEPAPRIITSRGTNNPYIIVVLSDTDSKLEITSASPKSGYVAKTKSKVFTWNAVIDKSCTGAITVSSSKFRWRTDSSSASTEIDCGTALTYTLPANTIATDSFQWQAEITDSLGNISTTDWYTLSTLEVLSTATCISPRNLLLDGSTDNEFIWEHNISTGTNSTGSELQYNDGNGWIALATISGSSLNTTISHGTFSSGEYTWRVRTYNTDNNPGEWSDSASFTVVAAPAMPTVTAEQNPRPIITWQSSEQQGYRVVIDGIYDSGIKYGTEKSFKLPLYLNDGSYVVGVIIQNEYGLCSTMGEAPINVLNVPGDAIALTIDNYSSSLRWETLGAYNRYIVYRDDKAIAITELNTYNDNITLGEHSYYIRGIFESSSNYGLSNTVNAVFEVECNTIIDLEDNVSLQLKNTDSSYTQIQIADVSTAALIPISASVYPIVERSKNKTRSITFNVAFTPENSDKTVFESMLGKIVCIKTVKGTYIVGIMNEVSKTESTFYVSYSGIVNQIDYEHEVII